MAFSASGGQFLGLDGQNGFLGILEAFTAYLRRGQHGDTKAVRPRKADQGHGNDARYDP